MSRPSTIDRLPEEARELIGRLRGEGWTIDEILARLREMQAEVSRSALGRHVKGLDALGEKMRRSRQVAEALVRELGDAPESRTARLNIELLHTAILDVFMKAADGETIAEGGQAALEGDPMGAMLLAKALDHLGRASKSNAEFLARAEARAAERAKREAVRAVESVAREKGISAATIEAIKSNIFGVRPDGA